MNEGESVMAISNKDIYAGDGKPLDKVVADFEKFNKKLEESIKLTNKLGDEISNNLRKETNKLNREATGEQIRNTQQLNEQLNNQRRNSESLTAEQRELQGATNQLNRINARQTREYQQVQAQIAQVRFEQNQRNRITREEIRISNSSSDSLARKKQLLRQLKEEYNDASQSIRQRLAPQIRALNDEIRDGEQAIGVHNRDVGRYQKVWEGFTNFAVKAGGIIATVGAIGRAFSTVTNRMIENGKNTRKVMNLMDLERKEAKALTIQLNALSNAYGVDFDSVLSASSSIRNNFILSTAEIKALVKESLSLATNQDEILQQIGEYSTQFKKAGVSAKEMIAVLIQGERLAVFSDKAPDTIKEATLALAENTKATSEAINAIENQAEAEIRRLMATGQFVEAIKLVSVEMNKNYLSTSEYQTLVADVFKGAGEDAGIFIEKLAELDLELGNLNDNLSDAEKSSIKLAENWSIFIDSFAQSDSIFGETATSIKNAIADIIGSVTDLSSSWSDFLLIFSGNTQALNERLIVNKVKSDSDEMILKFAEVAEARGEAFDYVSLKAQILDFHETELAGFELTKEGNADVARSLVASYQAYLDTIEKKKDEKEKIDEERRRRERDANKEKLRKETEDLEKELEKRRKIEDKERKEREKARDDYEKKQAKALDARKKADAKAVKDRMKQADDELKNEFKFDNDGLDLNLPDAPDWDKKFDVKGLQETAGQVADSMNTTQDILYNAYDAYSSLTGDSLEQSAERIAKYDEMLANAQSNLTDELRKKEQGFANTAENEQKTINELQVKRDEEMEHQKRLAVQQQAISKTIEAAKIAEAIANVIANSSKLGVFGLVSGFVGIAAMLAKFASFKAEAKQLNQGEIMIDGNGTETSDSIPAMLSKNESVIKAKSSKATPISLTKINNGEWDDSMLLPAMDAYYKENTVNNRYSFDDRSLKSNTSAVNTLADVMANKKFGSNSKRRRLVNGKNLN